MNRLYSLLLAPVNMFAAWTLIVWYAYVFDVSPAGLASISLLIIPLMVLAGMATLFAGQRHLFITGSTGRTESRSPISHKDKGNQLVLTLIAMGAAFALYAKTGSYLTPWAVLAAASLIFAREVFDNSPSPAATTGTPMATWLRLAMLAQFSLLIWYLGLGYMDTNADDVHYLNGATSFVTYPNLPIFSIDSLFGDTSRVNVMLMLNYGQSWEALVGFLRLTAGYEIFTTYYVVLPILSNFLISLCLFLFLHFNGQRFALLITFAVLLLMFEWGESGNLHGHFYATRIYQGKSVFIMLLVPLIFLHTQVLTQTDNWLNRVQLAFLLIVSGGLSSTGLYLSIIAAGAAFLVYSELSLPHWIKGLRTLVIAALPNIVMLLMALAQMVQGTPGDYTRDKGVPEIFGNGYLYVSLLCLMFWAITTLKVPSASTLRRISAVSLLFLMNPVIADFLIALSGINNLYWRYYWIVPISVILALAVSHLVSSAGVLLRPFKNPISSTYYLLGIGVLLLLTMWMIYSPTAYRSRFVVPFTDSALRLNNIGRIPRHIETAAIRLNDNLSERDIVLAPSWISMNLAKLEYRVKLTLIRPYYNEHLLRVGIISQDDYALLSSATDRLNRKYDPGTPNLDQSDLTVLYSMLERGLATVLLLPAHMISSSGLEVLNQENIQAQNPQLVCESLDGFHVICNLTN